MPFRVIVIEGDEWLATFLERSLTEKGHQAEVCNEARTGFQRICGSPHPDCIVCSFDLPDIDGLWVTRRVRTESGLVSRIPLILVGDVTDKTLRMQGYKAGADVVLVRPVSNEDIIAQIEALVGMQRRVRRESDPPPSSSGSAAALRGDLAMFPLASLLMMFEMERRSGVVEVNSSSGRRAILMLSHGLFASTEIDGKTDELPEVLREVLSWRAGRFSFVPRDANALPEPKGSVGAVVLEAMRLEDEKRVGQ